MGITDFFFFSLIFYKLSFFRCVKSVHIRSYSGPHFPVFELNTQRYKVALRIQSECGKMQTRITPNMNTFHAVFSPMKVLAFSRLLRLNISCFLYFSVASVDHSRLFSSCSGVL